ncbi:zinc finger protein 277-like [Astatotilapia calliptera]|uniref:zinc finger protein 277-like n=1 Tax=Astatotilapia calliptera TaxID=8154 RepID=UPI000E3F9987|nr:zinc finger protein 277-like [Astatotilapia calliptera]
MAASEPSKDGKDSILEPLCFPDQPADISSSPGVQCPGSEPLVCLFCSESVPPPRKDVLLRHLLMEHKLVIADVKLIADVPKYLLYWKGRFLEQPLTDFCSVIKTNSTGPVVFSSFHLCIVRSDWSDWQAHPVSAVCLFCDHQSETLEQIYAHMKEAHGFDLHLLKTELNLKFYQQVKLVNFIRRQIHQSRCYGCTRMFDCRADALRHIAAEGHVMKLPEMSAWDQPQYYFPTYENDALLCTLSDSEEGDGDEEHRGEEIPVIAEDISNLRALKQSSVLKQLLKERGGSS